MPSDARAQQALEAFSEPIREFRSTLANTREQIRLVISKRLEHSEATVEGARAEFGEFAAGRIDAERMARLLAKALPREIEHGDAIVRAFDVCTGLLARGDGLFQVDLEAGEDLRAAVGRALSEIGRAFGAARVVDLVSRASYRESEHGGLLDGHPFEDWSRAERAVEVCLAVRVAGGDLRVGGLADLVDGSLKIVLVVEGDAPPAPLVRLITPGVLVLQAAEAGELAWMAGFDGPGVAALVPASAAHFRHDPAAGPALADRLRITQRPDEPPSRRLGVSSVFQQRQELAQLEALAAAPSAAARSASAPVDAPEDTPAEEAPAPAPAVDDADKLAAWLLRQADVSGPS